MPKERPQFPEISQKDIKDHALNIVRDDGSHRYLRFFKPGTSAMSFSLVTWPGHLCYCGDMGCYVFSRSFDMFDFFRGRQPNLSYWAQKIVSRDRDGVKRFSYEVFRENVRSYFEDATDDWDKADKDALWEKIQMHGLLTEGEPEQLLLSRIDEFKFTSSCSNNVFRFADFWEYDHTKYTFWFTWCCHAIHWAIGVYDEEKKNTATFFPSFVPI